ncbi:MAG: L,D-transpeptidase family protein [Polyangiaceae bacterium]|nr:L,D-transpeptidase family protein [Polyangiaceae bacterium]
MTPCSPRVPRRPGPARARHLGLALALLSASACSTSFADATSRAAPHAPSGGEDDPAAKGAALAPQVPAAPGPAADGPAAHEPAADEPAADEPGGEPPTELHPELYTTCADARRIVVHKAARILELHCGARVVRRFEASLGFAPVGPKEQEGDGRTPEGEYFISRKFPSGFHRSLQLAYPNAADAADGLARGTITRAEHDAIVRALAGCREPPQTTGLGSLLQLHGHGGGADAGDWTLGCVAVDDPEIEEVYAFHRPGCDPDGRPRTSVVIRP